MILINKVCVAVTMCLILPALSIAGEARKVTVFNFHRAESDLQMAEYARAAGGIGKLMHMRDLYSIDYQPTIRGNRDTLYSMGTFDLSEPLTIIKPDPGERFQSLMYVNQDHSVFPTVHGPASVTLTRENVGTRYVWVLVRTFVNANDAADLARARGLQDQIVIQQADRGVADFPNWDEQSLSRVRSALNGLAAESVDDFRGYFGLREELDPIKHLMGTAYGWGGNRDEAAVYVNGVPAANDGQTAYTLQIRDVPVEGFWSITVYNRDGRFIPNPQERYGFNNVTAEPDPDGSYTFHFGGEPGARNYLPINEGWNYVLRLFRPGKSVLDGSWPIPRAEVSRAGSYD